jgi:signal transduction histidine kinase
MRIRTKLAWAFIVLIVVGIMTIAAYTIFVLRQYHTDYGIAKLTDDASRLGQMVQQLPPGAAWDHWLAEYHTGTGLAVAAFDSAGQLLMGVPAWQEVTFPRWTLDSLPRASQPIRVAEPESDWFFAFVRTGGVAASPVRYLRVGQPKRETFRVVQDVRWIIYTGMFLSLAVVVVASFWIARWVTKPIGLLRNQAAHIAAGGNPEAPLTLNTRDEFAELADSLNRMAERFRRDNHNLAQWAERQKRFYADITHELRNPLHSLLASVEVLQLDTLPHDQRLKTLAVVARQAQRLHKLFEDLMTLERSDRDPAFVKLRAVDLAPLLHQVAEAHRAQADEKGNAVSVNCASELTVTADPERLEQVLDNLVSNALKNTENGVVALEGGALADGRIRISVTDTGLGIAPEHLANLFDRFYRPDSSRSRDKGGAGLGLAVVQRIVEAFGSQIEVHSEPGVGTTFSFTLSTGE